MSETGYLQEALRRPYTSLVKSFVAWKALILFGVFIAPGVGYDTSTNLLLEGQGPHVQGYDDSLLGRLVLRLVQRLVRWDAIYLTSIADRGYVHEQEWAFSWGYTKLVDFIASAISPSSSSSTFVTKAIVATAVSNVAHLLSVLVLFQVSRRLLQPRQMAVSLVTGLLHIAAPAGVFLSAPYAESLFALLNFTGYFYYIASRSAASILTRTIKNELQLLVAGAFFAGACLVRSNGLFNGLIFIYDLVTTLPGLFTQKSSLVRLRYLVTLVVAGSLVACGFILPQYLAYLEYCANPGTGPNTRSWCMAMPPSIYTFVQSHYWNVGFLRYWTVSNLPLFMLGAPTLALMFVSGLWAFRLTPCDLAPSPTEQQRRTFAFWQPASLRRLAVPQMVLAALALSSFHVQIITRIGSAYPVAYLWTAAQLVASPDRKEMDRQSTAPRWMVRWMVVYAAVQCGLFACFLPPA